ncbi:MAG: phosphoheptose isomerase [Flavobacteriales bacterium]|nr:phosphoheptose isomerase [Flavobacteriales bacterium]
MSIHLVNQVDEKGNHISPALPKHIKNFLIDIDGTVSEDVPNEEPERMLTCEEIPGAKKFVNKWYDEGHIITFFTSRLEEHRAYTEQWLKDHGFKWHGIIFGKPRGGNYHWIDDRSVKATRFVGNFTDLVKVKRVIEVFADKDDSEE